MTGKESESAVRVVVSTRGVGQNIRAVEKELKLRMSRRAGQFKRLPRSL